MDQIPPIDLRGAVDAVRVQWGLPVASLADRLRSRGVPAIFHHLLASGGCDETVAIGLVRDLLAGKGFLLVLAGDAGTGKSFAAAWGLAQRSGFWAHAPLLAQPSRDGEEPLDVKMRSAGLLVLDDCGLEHSPGGYAASRIQDVIVAREAARVPTIATTNLSSEEFVARYGGPRMGSRLDGDPLGWHSIGGRDLRPERRRSTETAEGITP